VCVRLWFVFVASELQLALLSHVLLIWVLLLSDKVGISGSYMLGVVGRAVT
jgi:hypothetical protein